MKSSITALASVAMASPLWAQQTPVAPVPATTLAVPFVQIPFPAPPPALPAKVPSGLVDIIRAKFPLSIGFDDLGAGWRVLNFQGQNYFTKGEATFLRQAEYLVVYRESSASLRALSPLEYRLYATRGVLPRRAAVRFSLSLLSMDRVQSYLTDGQTGLRSFDLTDYGSAPLPAPSQAFQQNLSLVYLRKIAEALRAFSDANLATLPPLDTAFEARQNLEPFAENAAIFTQPGADVPFKWNPILSGRKRAHLKGKNSFVIAYEGEAAPDGSRGILRLGGQVSRVSESVWQKLKEASKIE
ncbi:MAG TPA: hypothetical protein VGB45_09590 [Abditibacterium sp.]|jgi:hypothetical protein